METVEHYRLASAEARAKESPKTFRIPPEPVRRAIRNGMLVKLIFELKGVPAHGPAAERMWVEVLGKDGPRYYGTLCNDPGVIPGLKRGQEVWFGPEHVASIESPGD